MNGLLNRNRVARIASALCALSFVVACSNNGNQNPTGPTGVDVNAAKSPSASSVGNTNVSFSAFDASTLRVAIGTLTTSAVGQPYISQGKIHFQILVDNISHNPVPCGTPNSTYVRFDGQGGGVTLDAAGATSLMIDLDDLDALTDGAVHNVHCGDSICIRAQYVTGGGQTKVDTHTSAETPYEVVCASLSCTLGLGYWKNHYDAAWPTSVVAGGMTLGTVHYTAAELQSILNEVPKGNGLIVLAHQLITAKLNVANGTSAGVVASAIASADVLIGGLVAPPVGTGYLAPSLTDVLTQTLDDFNSGKTGPGACSGS